MIPTDNNMCTPLFERPRPRLPNILAPLTTGEWLTAMQAACIQDYEINMHISEMNAANEHQLALFEPTPGSKSIFGVVRLSPRSTIKFKPRDSLNMRSVSIGDELHKGPYVWKVDVLEHSHPAVFPSDLFVHARVPQVDNQWSQEAPKCVPFDASSTDIKAALFGSLFNDSRTYNMVTLTLANESTTIKAELRALNIANNALRTDAAPATDIRDILPESDTFDRVREHMQALEFEANHYPSVIGSDFTGLETCSMWPDGIDPVAQLALMYPNDQLNLQQERAIAETAYRDKDLFLVQGPPGTGKTLVASLICSLAIELEYRVLGFAASNKGVDNFLLNVQARRIACGRYKPGELLCHFHKTLYETARDTETRKFTEKERGDLDYPAFVTQEMENITSGIYLNNVLARNQHDPTVVSDRRYGTGEFTSHARIVDLAKLAEFSQTLSC